MIGEIANKNYLFTRYSMKVSDSGDHYVVKKYSDDGSKVKIIGDERDRVLSGELIKGSLAFTKDRKHKTWLHLLIYVIQSVHSFFTGRGKKTDSDICHGFIVTGESISASGAAIPRPSWASKIPFHQLMTVDPCFQGVLRISRDNLRPKATGSVSKVYIYTPRDRTFSQQISDLSTKCSYPLKNSKEDDSDIKSWANYDPNCIADSEKRHPFSLAKLAFCSLFNGRKLVSNNPGRRVTRYTAKIVADLISERQIVNSKGSPRDFYCASFVTSIVQGALFTSGIKKVVAVDSTALRRFITNVDGETLSREALIRKIVDSFNGAGDSNDPIVNMLHSTFINNKLARADGQYMLSSRSVELANKMSHARSQL